MNFTYIMLIKAFIVTLNYLSPAVFIMKEQLFQITFNKIASHSIQNRINIFKRIFNYLNCNH